MENVVTQILVNILILFITGTVIIMTSALEKWLKAKMKESDENGKILIYKALYDIVRFVVQGIEQMYLSGAEWSSETKKAKAVTQVTEWVTQNGYDKVITPQLVSTVIEACVKEMNESADMDDESY